MGRAFDVIVAQSSKTHDEATVSYVVFSCMSLDLWGADYSNVNTNLINFHKLILCGRRVSNNESCIQ